MPSRPGPAESRPLTPDLSPASEKLRALSARLQRVREEERARIAREIHDELGQALTGLKLDLAWLGDDPPASRRAARRRLMALTRRVDETIQAVRRITTALRPPVLDHLGLVAALEWQSRDFAARTGVRVRFDSTLRDEGLDPDVATSVFRIFQEALTNVARHAAASRVAVRASEEGAGLLVEVKDDGRGITEREREDPASLGLLGMEERALMIGGTLEVRGAPGEGTVVTLHVPARGAAGPAP